MSVIHFKDSITFFIVHSSTWEWVLYWNLNDLNWTVNISCGRKPEYPEKSYDFCCTVRINSFHLTASRLQNTLRFAIAQSTPLLKLIVLIRQEEKLSISPSHVQSPRLMIHNDVTLNYFLTFSGEQDKSTKCLSWTCGSISDA